MPRSISLGFVVGAASSTMTAGFIMALVPKNNGNLLHESVFTRLENKRNGLLFPGVSKIRRKRQSWFRCARSTQDGNDSDENYEDEIKPMNYMEDEGSLDVDDVYDLYFSLDDDDTVDEPDEEELLALEQALWGDDENSLESEELQIPNPNVPTKALEEALLKGVVPAGAGVGSGCLPGDYGFDPLNLATKDYIPIVQRNMLKIVGPSPASEEKENGLVEEEVQEPLVPRPSALILRDYREAEIRHGRLAMLAATIWPLQELLDSLVIPVSSEDFTVVYGGTTLPYLSLCMIAAMLLLGYLDIFAEAIKEGETGEAFLPGECFWDPLSILDGATDATKVRMQERELANGRFAMMAVLVYTLEEAISHKPLVSLSTFNLLLFRPIFEIPVVQEWLDLQFQGPSVIFPTTNSIDFVDAIQTILDEGTI